MNKLRERLINEFINCLARDIIPWQRGFKLPETPYNPVSGTRYRGVNRMALSFFAERHNDPRFVTFVQAKNNGWKIRKGESGYPVEFFSFYDRTMKQKISPQQAAKLKNSLEPEEYKDRIYIVSTVTMVFNAEQIEEIPELQRENVKAIHDSFKEIFKYRDNIIKNMAVKLKEGEYQAFYKPKEDTIYLPYFEHFDSPYSYISTFLHEAAHATGSSDRLNRDIENVFGSQDYAKEELKAEISSCFVAQSLGIPDSHNSVNNHVAYVQNWLQILNREPDELFKAIKDAEGISDYLIERGEFFKGRENTIETKKEADIGI